MGKKKKQRIQRTLCGLLVSAMIATSLIVPDMTAYAMPADGIDTETTGDGSQGEETPENEGGLKDDPGNENGDEGADSGTDGAAEEGSASEDGAGDEDDAGSDEAGKDVDAEDDLTGSDADDKNADAEQDTGKDKAADQKDSADKNNRTDEEDLEEEPGEMLLTMAARTYGTLQNGDFEDCGTDGDKTWANNWTVTEGPWIEDKGATGTDSKYLYCNLNWADSLEMTAYQPIDSAEPGVYVASVEAGGTYGADSFQLLVTAGENVYDWEAADKPSQYTDKLGGVGLGEGKGSSQWGAPAVYLTDAFEVTADKSNLIVTLTGTITRDQLIYLDNVKLEKVTYDHNALQSLLTTAGEKEEAAYTAESWTIFQTKLDAAKAVTNEATGVEIATAYTALEKAMKELVPADTGELIFYYYAEPAEGETEAFELGVALWNEANGHSVTTSETEKVSWNEQYYKMQPVTGYAHWYQIPLLVVDEITNKGTEDGSDTGFAIYKKAADKEATEIAKFSGWSNGNPTIYAKLLAEGTKACAVKNNKGYVDNAADQLATAIMRNVTLHVYSADGAPYLQMGGAVQPTLSKVNEETGGLESLTPAAEQVDSQTAYALEREEGSDWYAITFTVPGTFTFKKDEQICNLYYGSTYNASFMNGSRTGETWGTDFTPVFAGKVYYKDGEFLAEKPDTPTSDEKMFYFHCASDEGETEAFALGVELWGGEEKISTTEAETYSWLADKVLYKMQPVEGYADWYQIPLKITDTIANSVSGAGFTIYKKTAEGEAGKAAEFSGYPGKNEDIYAMLLAEDTKACAVKNWKGYVNNGSKKDATAVLRNITFHIYAEDAPAFQLDETGVSKLTMVNEETGEVVDLPADGTDSYGQPIWILTQPEETENWYQISLSVPGAVSFDGKKVLGWEMKDAGGKYVWHANFMNGTGDGVDLTPVFAGKTWYKDGEFLAEKPVESPLLKLKKLIAQAKALKEEEYKPEGWADLQTALTAAEAVVTKAEAAGAKPEEDPLKKEIQDACDTLEAAIEALVPSKIAEINVKKVAVADDFIMGADLSSYIALRESGVEFKDENGRPLSDSEFFKYMYDGGTNWVRIRVWNDPYDARGNGYGGGNNDLDKAKRIGKLASNAGMKVLIDFHYSDFWADPNKQKAPKAWANDTVEQKAQKVYDYTLDSLNQLKDAGVSVDMVQVGNETNNGICGVTGWDDMGQIFAAGCKAIDAYNTQNNAACLKAVHFTDAHKGFTTIAGNLKAAEEKYGFTYDVFASSFYPFGHGDAKNLNQVLTDVARQYNKLVMAAETSWPTTLIDGDGLGNVAQPVIPDQYKSQDYGISVQGQADEMRDLVDQVNQINDKCPGQAIGVFYWEPAWISPYYIKNEDGSDNMELYRKNQALWEKYGSGWASSYAAEYDPDDAGVWYGGSAMDHSSWFDFDGTALPTAKIYSLIRSGAAAGAKRISSVQSVISVTHTQGEALDWNADEMKPLARYNDGTTEKLNVVWNREEKENADPNRADVYVVHGTAVGGGKEYQVTLTLTITKKLGDNILVNPDFESNQSAPWKIEQRGEGVADIKTSTEDTHNNSNYGLHFWSSKSLDFTVSQTVTPGAGTYRFGGFIQGGGADNEADVQYAYVKLTHKDDTDPSKVETKTYQKEFGLNGWLKWSNPEIADIVVEDGDELEVGVIIKAKAGAWGTIDDFYLYGAYGVSVGEGIAHGTVTVNTDRADSGDRITVTLLPEAGYYADYLEVNGTELEWLESDEAAASEADAKTRLTWAAHEAKERKVVFIMPKHNVEIGAAFGNVFDAGAIDLSAKDQNGNYLVKVNASAEEKPIRAQFRSNKAVKPTVKLTYQGYELVLNQDYKVSYQNNNAVTVDAKLILTGNGTKFKGTRTIVFEIKNDTRKPFDTKNIKVVFEKDDKGVRNVSASKAVFYLGKKNELTPAVKLYAASDTNYTTPLLTGKYDVFYQNNKKLGKGTVVIIPKDEVTEDPDGYREGSITVAFKISKCPLNQKDVAVTFPNGTQEYEMYYTGSKLRPDVIVSYGDETLVKGRDYTLSYSNNVNASEYVTKDENGSRTGYAAKYPTKPDKWPSVTITGKGNFSGKRTTFAVDDAGKAKGDKINFRIRPRELKLATITVGDLTQKSVAQAPKITVKDGGRTVASSQYVITQIKQTELLQADGTLKAVSEVLYTAGKTGQTTKVIKNAGTYEIEIEGKEKSNYAGEVGQSDKTAGSKLIAHVRSKDYLIDNAKIKVTGKFYYTGKQITLDTENAEKPELKVYYTVKGKEVRLKEKRDYTVKYENNVNAGKAQITITGMGDYQGQKKAAFTIGKRTLAKEGTVAAKDRDKKGTLPIPELSFKRAAKEWDALSFAETGDAESAYGKDTTLARLGNRDEAVGVDGKRPSAPLVMPYTGQVMEPAFYFGAINYSNADIAANKDVGEIDPIILEKGDYTLSYAIGKQKKVSVTKGGVTEEVVYLPVTVTLKGKGNYSGSVKYENLFSLRARKLEEFTLSAAPVTYNGKALKPEIIFRENATGKSVNFKLGVAYTVSYRNNTDATDNPKNITSSGRKATQITVTVKGKGWVTTQDVKTKKRILPEGSAKEAFRIERAEITRACVGDVVFQTFLGKTLKPKVKVKVNGRTLKEGRDYTIKYDENIRRGMAGKVTITGKGNYFTRTPIEKRFVIK